MLILQRASRKHILFFVFIPMRKLKRSILGTICVFFLVYFSSYAGILHVANENNYEINNSTEFEMERAEPVPLDFAPFNTDFYAEKCGGKYESPNVLGWYKLFSEFEKRQEAFLKNGGRNVLIWDCKKHPPPGLADHARGFIVTFLLALLTERAFLIQYNNLAPVKLDQVFNIANNRLKWNIDTHLEADIHYNWRSSLKEPEMKDSRIPLTPRNVSISICALAPVQRAILSDPFYSQKIKDLGLDKVKQEDLPGCLMNYFMKPKPLLESVLEGYKEKAEGKTIIGVQFRSGKGI
jgi:hypothetical protein